MNPATLATPRVPGCIELSPHQIEAARLAEEIRRIAEGAQPRAYIGSNMAVALENYGDTGRRTPRHHL